MTTAAAQAANRPAAAATWAFGDASAAFRASSLGGFGRAIAMLATVRLPLDRKLGRYG
jgi:hypothetical protein